MNISLETWFRNKLQEIEEMHDYSVATDTVRCWIDEYKQLSQHDVINNEVSVCEKCLGRGSIVIYDTCLDCDKCGGTGTQTVL